MVELNGKNICIIGAGKSGVGAAELLARTDAQVTIYDGKADLDCEEITSQLPDTMKPAFILGDLTETDIAAQDLFVVSPGVPLDGPEVTKIKAADKPLIGEIELAYQFEKGRVLAVTGTNGKTTTTALLGHLMKGHVEDVFVVGNIGTPYTEDVVKTHADSVTVIEVSSFQLESTVDFHPEVSTILNLTPDHLNRHHTMEAYFEAKKQIAANRTEGDCCVLNYEDEALRAWGEELQREGVCEVVFFSSRRSLHPGLYLEDGRIICDDGTACETICEVDALPLLGEHNYENVMAASAMAMKAGAPVGVVRERVLTFVPVPHRMEYVGEVDGVVYYNDSKGTNPDAAIKAISAMRVPTYLIAGGYDKGSDYTEWIRAFGGRVKKLILMGATAQAIADCAKANAFPEGDIVFVESMEEAVRFCKEHAKPGEGVLLSPACASWGMFDNYEQRGDCFKELTGVTR